MDWLGRGCGPEMRMAEKEDLMVPRHCLDQLLAVFGLRTCQNQLINNSDFLLETVLTVGCKKVHQNKTLKLKELIVLLGTNMDLFSLN